MKPVAINVIVISVALLSSTALAADVNTTINQKNGWATYQTELNRITTKVNGKCGSNIAGSYDQSTYTAFDPLQDRTQSACQQAVGTLEAICATEPGKQAVQGLKTAVCQFSTTGTGISVEGSTLTVKIDPANSSIAGKQPGSYSWKSAIEENM